MRRREALSAQITCSCVSCRKCSCRRKNDQPLTLYVSKWSVGGVTPKNNLSIGIAIDDGEH